MRLDSIEKPAPGGSGTSIFQQEMGAVLVFRTDPDAPPVIVGDYLLHGQMMFIHQEGGELGCVVDGLDDIVAVMLAHLDADGVVIAGAIEVGVLALLVGGQVLVSVVVFDREMPDEEADAVAAGAFVGTQRAALQGECVMPGVAGGVLRGMNRDVAHIHRAELPPAISPARNHVLNQSNLREHLDGCDLAFDRNWPEPGVPALAARAGGGATGKKPKQHGAGKKGNELQDAHVIL